jgi:hypothetical protein
MKTKSMLVRSIGALLALLVFVSLPSSLLAVPFSDDVIYELYYGIDTDLALELVCPNPTGATIFYTVTFNQENNYTPTHTGTTCGPHTSKFASGSKLHIPFGSTMYVNAIAWKAVGYGDSEHVTSAEQHNPNT